MVTKTKKTKKTAVKPTKKVGKIRVVEKVGGKAEKKTVREVVEVKPQQDNPTRKKVALCN